ncbi:unnamed protein product [Rotaria magnacalcarata]
MSKKLLTPKQEPVGPDAVRDMMIAAQKQIKNRQQEINFTTLIDLLEMILIGVIKMIRYIYTSSAHPTDSLTLF